MALSLDERNRLIVRFRWIRRQLTALAAGTPQPDKNPCDMVRWYLDEINAIEFALGEG